ncbi:MAG: phosphate ABC transporter permease [Chloroflexi bacterium HGW-Chloroflexi-10]|nr:MAG: phosphate ABC transporter permease [Chloroflexi bacterium HGW-Chloroflexi-10]
MQFQNLPYKKVYSSNSSKFPKINIKELWEYKELLFFLTLRDIQIRYKQAALGILWALLQPLLAMIIFSVIFGNLAKLPSDNIPYAVFSYAGLMPWQLFAGAISRSGNSLVANRNLLTKVYFPRIIIPLSATLSGLIEYFIGFIMFIGLLILFNIKITWTILLILPLTVGLLITAFSIGVWISALNVQYRDFEHITPFLIQIWLYASPVVYSSNLIPDGIYQTIFSLNPMTGVIDCFRWALLGSSPPSKTIFISLVVVLLILFSGILYFKKMEDTFADIV